LIPVVDDAVVQEVAEQIKKIKAGKRPLATAKLLVFIVLLHRDDLPFPNHRGVADHLGIGVPTVEVMLSHHLGTGFLRLDVRTVPGNNRQRKTVKQHKHYIPSPELLALVWAAETKLASSKGAPMPFAPYVDDDEIIDPEHKSSIQRLTRDLAIAARTMGPKEARFLVDAYYTSQDNRKRAANQARSMEKSEQPEPHILLDWLFEQSRILESQIKRALDEYTQGHIMGEWMRSIVGIGPVISAGMLAHLEGPRPTAGRIYAFAGLAAEGQKPWKSGEKRPYNVQLKTLCWHAGQSFMKLAARPDCYYGHVYRERKVFEQRMNDEGKRTATAAEWVTRVGKTTEAHKHYSAGRLPPSQIDGRARRYAVKLFLSHMNEVWMKKLGVPVAAPFPIGRLGHADYIPPPNAP